MTISAAVGTAIHTLHKRRCRELRLICDFLNEMTVLMQFRASHIRTIIDELSRRGSYEKCGFLKYLCSSVTEESDVQELWRNAAVNAAFLGDDEKNILASIGDSLGGSDTEGQAAVLGAQRLELCRILSESEEECRSRGKLIASVCPLLGIGLTIMLI